MKVKLMKDLPGCKAGTYGSYLDDCTRLWYFGQFSFPDAYIKDYPDFFEILPELKFRVGDWGWHVVDGCAVRMDAEDVSMANSGRGFINRFATTEEINAVTEKEDKIGFKRMGRIIEHPIIIRKDRIYFEQLMVSEVNCEISELRRIIEIADKLLPRD